MGYAAMHSSRVRSPGARASVCVGRRPGQCGHGTFGDIQPLPRRAEALVGVRVRSASVGDWHSLVVTEGGALYSFGLEGERLGRDHVKRTAKDPEIVDALRHVRIVAAAAGASHSVALTETGLPG